MWKRQWRDHPLRRRIDIVEAWVLLALATVLCVGALAAGTAVAVSVYAHDRTVASDQEASRRHVRAEVVREAPEPATPVGETGRGDKVRTLVRWTAPDGSHAQGTALVPAGTERGQRTDVWLDAKGQVTKPPLSHRNIVAGAVTIGAFTAAAGVGAAAGIGLLVRNVAGRRRIAGWEREWRQVGPGWTRHGA